MRLIYLALVVSALVLALGVVSAARSGDPASQQLAANAAANAAIALPALRGSTPEMPEIMSPIRDGAPLQFCGQCTGDSDCGTGHKCCGPSNCLECFRVDTCP